MVLDQRNNFEKSNAPETMSEGQRLKYLTEHFDDFKNLTMLPQNEDDMVLYHLGRVVARTTDDLPHFFSEAGDSKEVLGFYKNQEGLLTANGKTQSPSETANQFLTRNLDDNDPAKKDIIHETLEAAKHFDFLKNYVSITNLKSDIDKVAVLRQFSDLDEKRAEQRKRVVEVTKEKAEALSNTAKETIIKRSADNEIEAALINYALSSTSIDLKRDNSGEIDVNATFSTDTITKYGLAVKNGQVVMPFKKSGDTIEYSYVTFMSASSVERIIDSLSDPTHVSDIEKDQATSSLREGAEYFNSHMEVLKNKENAEFLKNAELFKELSQIPESLLIPVEDLDEAIRPTFEEDEEFSVGRLNGNFYAMSAPVFDRSTCYKFDAEKGWHRIDRFPKTELGIPPLLRETTNGFEPNTETFEALSNLPVTPKEVLTHTINVLYEKVKGNNNQKNSLLTALVFNPPAGITIPFPALKDIEINLSDATLTESISNVEVEFLMRYSEFFPGMDMDALRFISKEVAHLWLTNLKEHGKDQTGQPLNKEGVYTISVKENVDVGNALNPANSEVLFDIDKEFSAKTKERIEKIHAYIENLTGGIFSKVEGVVSGVVSSLAGMLGIKAIEDMANKFLEDFLKKPLGDLWDFSEKVAVEWEATEASEGKALSFKEFVPNFAIKAFKEVKDPNNIGTITEKSLLGTVLGLAGWKAVEGRMIRPEQLAEISQQRAHIEALQRQQLEQSEAGLEAAKHVAAQTQQLETNNEEEEEEKIKRVSNFGELTEIPVKLETNTPIEFEENLRLSGYEVPKGKELRFKNTQAITSLPVSWAVKIGGKLYQSSQQTGSFEENLNVLNGALLSNGQKLHEGDMISDGIEFNEGVRLENA